MNGMFQKGLKKKKRERFSLVLQLDVIIVLGLVISAFFTWSSQYYLSLSERKKSVKNLAGQIAGDTIASVKEFPAYSWLLRYWYEHADTMEVEYNGAYLSGSETEDKRKRLNKLYPELQLRYARVEEIEALPEEDQKLYAEVAYSWLISRVDQIKQNYKVSYLYCTVTETDPELDPYMSQFYIFSGADPGAQRGTEYGQVYPLGFSFSTSEEPGLQSAMREAVESARDRDDMYDREDPELDETGYYLDEYSFLGWIGTRAALVGISFDLHEVMAQVAEETWRGTLFSMCSQFLLLQLVMFLFYFFDLRQFKKILQNIRLYSKEKNSVEVRKNLSETLSGFSGIMIRENEIGQLARDFTELTEELDQHVRQIETMTADNERIEAELRLASGIQMQMVPDARGAFRDRSDFSLFAAMHTAREVGGDFYDFFLVDDRHLALVIADVSGKSVPAALFMVIAKTLIKNRAQMGQTPAQILGHVNTQLCEGNEMGFFVTVWLAIVDLSTGRGVAANAGHEHPVLARAGEKFELVRYKHSPIIGMLEDITYKEHAFELHPGDRLFVYTDGVPEAVNSENVMFGTDRMLDVLNKNPQAPLEELLHDLKAAIDDFADGGDQFDDITMMCLQYNGAVQDM